MRDYSVMNITPSFQASSNAEHPKKVTTKKDRRLQLAKLFLITFISMTTVVLTIIDMIQTAKSFREKEELTDKIQGSIDMALLIHNLQKERGMTTLQMGFKEIKLAGKQLELREIRRKTNESITILETRQDVPISTLTGETKSFWYVLENFRRQINKGGISGTEIFLTYSEWITTLISTLTKFSKFENLDDNANLFFAYEMVIISKEEAGMERALGGLKFTQGTNFSSSNTIWYNEKRVLAQKYLTISFLFSSEIKNIHASLFSNTSDLMKKIEKKRKVLSDGWYNKTSNDEAYEWFELMTKYNNLMLELQLRQADLLQEKVEDKRVESKNQLVIRSLLLCFTVIIVPVIVVSLARVQKSFYEYTLSLFDKVGLEQARTDFIMRENARHVQSKCI